MSNILDANSYIDYFSEPKEEFRMTPNARFTEFLTDIEPSSTTKTNASSAHIKLRATLRADETFGPMHRHTFLSGSYKRDTDIRPRIKDGNAQRPDADIMRCSTAKCCHPSPTLTFTWTWKTSHRWYWPSSPVEREGESRNAKGLWKARSEKMYRREFAAKRP